MGKVVLSNEKLRSKEKFIVLFNKQYISSFIIAIFGFFLGRVIIFEIINPVVISFIGSFLGTGYKFYIIIFLTFLGLLSKFEGIYLLKYILSFIILCGFEAMMKTRNTNMTLYMKAIISSITIFISGLLISYIYDNSVYSFMMIGLESILVFSLIFIFRDGIEILYGSVKRKSINSEQLISLSLLLGSIIAGTSDIYLAGISLKLILCNFIILIVSWQGGSAMGSTTGVLLGFILTITGNTDFSLVGILSIAGMIAGIMKNIGKYSTIIGFCVGSTITALYLNSEFLTTGTLYSILISSVFFLFLSQKFYFNIDTLINFNTDNTEDYIDRIKELTTYRLEGFAKSFDRLANIFIDVSKKKNTLNQKDVSKLIDDVAIKTCSNCKNKNNCWESNFYNTYQMAFALLGICEKKGYVKNSDVPRNIYGICCQQDKFLDNINRTFEICKNNLVWNNKILESRQLVSQQLKGVSGIIKNLSKELNMDFCFNTALEEELLKELSRNKIDIDSIIVLQNKDGKFEVTLNYYKIENCKNVINIVSKVLERKMKKEENHTYFPFVNKNNLFKLRLVEEQKFKVAIGVSRIPKNNSKESGDTYSFMDIKNGQTLLVLSDGMGSGIRAKEESNITVELLEEFINTGFDKEIAIKIINSILILKSNEEIFSTLDLCCIDLYTGISEFIKIGGSSTFIIRDGKVSIIKNSNLPIGILNTVDIDITNKRLKDSDIVVMVTDGITEIDTDYKNKEEWIMNVLSKFKSNNPQDISDNLLQEAIKLCNNVIKDDMTVMAARIWEKS